MDSNNIEALIDYISTSPENINYNMVREILDAIINENDHPYFDYYVEKMGTVKVPGGLPTPTGEELAPTNPGESV